MADSEGRALSKADRQTSVRLGSFELSSRFALSPMAEFTSWPLRILAQEFGASFACTEMVKAKFVASRNEDTLDILRRHPEERLCGGQICGGDAEELARAAQILVRDLAFPFVDFNMACPIKRVVSEGAGGGLLQDPEKVRLLVKVLVDASAPAPVTVKMRSGLDESSITAVEIAQAAEAGGAVMIALHPRTVRQGYGGRADHGVVEAVAGAVSVPVVGGGDVNSPADALRLLQQSGCDLVYFARAAIGNPWLFSRARGLLEDGEDDGPPALDDFKRIFLRHARMLSEHLGEGRGCRHVRRLSREYAKVLPDADMGTRFYMTLNGVERMEEIVRIVTDF